MLLWSCYIHCLNLCAQIGHNCESECSFQSLYYFLLLTDWICWWQNNNLESKINSARVLTATENPLSIPRVFQIKDRDWGLMTQTRPTSVCRCALCHLSLKKHCSYSWTFPLCNPSSTSRVSEVCPTAAQTLSANCFRGQRWSQKKWSSAWARKVGAKVWSQKAWWENALVTAAAVWRGGAFNTQVVCRWDFLLESNAVSLSHDVLFWKNHPSTMELYFQSAVKADTGRFLGQRRAAVLPDFTISGFRVAYQHFWRSHTRKYPFSKNMLNNMLHCHIDRQPTNTSPRLLCTSWAE